MGMMNLGVFCLCSVVDTRYLLSKMTSNSLFLQYLYECVPQACARAEFKGTMNIGAHGAYSLANAYIESAQPDGATQFTLSLYGHHAGYGARVHCKTNHTCRIYCAGDACENLLLDCDGTCYRNSSTSVDFTSPDGLKYANLDDYAHQINVQCENNQHFVFDAYRETWMEALIDSGNDPLCCRGYQSYVYIEIIVLFNVYVIC